MNRKKILNQAYTETGAFASCTFFADTDFTPSVLFITRAINNVAMKYHGHNINKSNNKK